jgi:ribosome-binding factor A
MRSHRSAEPSQRQLRVGEQLRHIIAETMQRGHFHHEVLMNSGITVTEVRVSPDLKNATAYVISRAE